MNQMAYQLKRLAVWVISKTGGIQISLGLRCRDCSSTYAFHVDITDLVVHSIKHRAAAHATGFAAGVGGSKCSDCDDCQGEGCADGENHLN